MTTPCLKNKNRQTDEQTYAKQNRQLTTEQHKPIKAEDYQVQLSGTSFKCNYFIDYCCS